jgi:hypothetical protein
VIASRRNCCLQFTPYSHKIVTVKWSWKSRTQQPKIGWVRRNTYLTAEWIYRMCQECLPAHVSQSTECESLIMFRYVTIAYAVWLFWNAYYQFSEQYLTIFSAVGLNVICWRLVAIPKYIYGLGKKSNPSTSLDIPRGFLRSWGSEIPKKFGPIRWKVCVAYSSAAFTCQENFLVLTYVKCWVGPWAIVRPEGLYQLKNPRTPSGIETANFQLVAQCLDQLRHCVPLVIC